VIAVLGHWIVTGGQVCIALVALRLAFGLLRMCPRSKPGWRHFPATVWARLRWRWLARNLNLAYLDQHRRASKRPSVPFGTSVRVVPMSAGQPMRLRFPRARFRADEYGIIARVKTVPGVGRQEFDANCSYIADAWRCVRVQVSQPKPGRVVVRGLRSDPLLVPYSAAAANVRGTNIGATGPVKSLYLGRDEWGQDRYRQLAGLTGITISGLPDFGKTSFVLSLLMQLAELDCVQFVFVDGKGGLEYDDWRDRAWIHVGDDLPAAAGAFEDVHALMRSRFPVVLEQTGYRNAWHRGPTREFPLIVTVVDECHTFFDLDGVKGDRGAEMHVRACRTLAGQLVRKGRSVLMLTVFITQKQTADAIPTAIRDNCGLGLSFAVKTKEAAVAALGDGIREYPSYCPTTLQDPAYVGVCTASLRTGLDPFVRIRVPEVTEQAAIARARQTASMRRDPTEQYCSPVPSGTPVTCGVTADLSNIAHPVPDGTDLPLTLP
jgi:S-DNA-T family DNA segregation ATPase FtsK/SpoIIIE